MADKEKEEAKQAAEELHKLLGQLPGEARGKAYSYLKTIERYHGSLRRDRAVLDTEVLNSKREVTTLRTRVTAAETALADMKANTQRETQRIKQELAREKQKAQFAWQTEGDDRHIDYLLGNTPVDPERYGGGLLERMAALPRRLEKYIPNLTAFIKRSREDTIFPVMVIPQDAVGIGYTLDELTLAGMVVKVAGVYGTPLLIYGHSGQVNGTAPGPPVPALTLDQVLRRFSRLTEAKRVHYVRAISRYFAETYNMVPASLSRSQVEVHIDREKLVKGLGSLLATMYLADQKTTDPPKEDGENNGEN